MMLASLGNTLPVRCRRPGVSALCRSVEPVAGPGGNERLGLGPKLGLTKEEALSLQLKVGNGVGFWMREECVQSIQTNNMPYPNHGIEVIYRFTLFDPFERTRFFGVNLDLGQFERFKRVFATPFFKPLVGHNEHQILSQLDVSSNVWKARVLVRHGLDAQEEATYEVTLSQKAEGKRAGIWMTSSIIRDDTDGLESML